MVLESLISPRKAGGNPLNIFFVTIVYTAISLFFANVLFPSQSSMLSVALVTMIFLPFFQKLFVMEEEKEEVAAKRHLKTNLFVRHIKIIKVFAAFFLGVVVTISFAYALFPTNSAFSLQVDVIKNLSPNSGAFVSTGDFSRFFVNNTQVMVVTYILSILFGAGAIFILSWNASVIGAYIGIIAQSFVNKGYPIAAAYILGLPTGLGSIFLHGVPEILAYFLAAVAGGVLSVGIIREKWKGKEFHLIVKDSIKFLIIAEVLIFVAAFIEAV